MDIEYCEKICPVYVGCTCKPGGDSCVERLIRTTNAQIERYKKTESRLKHLLESEYIVQFDKLDPKTQKYARDIKEADAPLRPLPAPDPVKTQPVYFICDRRKCDVCNGDCNRTTDIRHAENFVINMFGALEEKER